MSVITRKHLEARFQIAAKQCNWQTGDVYTNGRANVNVVYLVHQPYSGWSIERVSNDAGGVATIVSGLSASQMQAWLGGAIEASRSFNLST